MPLPFLLLGLPVLAASLFWVFSRSPRFFTGVGWLTSFAFWAGSAWLIMLDYRGESLYYSHPWVPELGIDFSLHLSPFTEWFGALVLGLGGCIILYATTYFKNNDRRNYILALLCLFTTAMLGILWSDNLYLLFLFWEATSALSFLLVGFHHEREETREKASQALLVTLTGGAALLVGFVLLHNHFGTSSLVELLEYGSIGAITPTLSAAVVLIIIGAFTKSAQWPFHFWLPNAMAGPTPVSAFLHSATMVKAGVFLLAVLSPLLSQHPIWTPILTVAGLLTVCVAILRASREEDLKAILASTTLAALGFLTILAGLGTPSAQLGFLIFLTAHALYKAPLFLSAGNLEMRYGTRRLSGLHGAFYRAPVTGTIILISVLSLLGVAPLPGFLGKEYLLKALWSESPVKAIAVALGAAGVLALGFRLLIPLFRRTDRVEVKRPLPRPLLVATLLPALGALALTFSLPLANHAFLGPAATALGAYQDSAYKVWHGWTPALGLGIGALLCALILSRTLLKTNLPPLTGSFAPLFEGVFNTAIRGIRLTARDLARLITLPSFPKQIAILLLVVGALIFVSLRPQQWPEIELTSFSESATFFIIAPLIIISSIAAARAKSAITLLVALGFVGLSIAFLFLWFSAPDLALTQLLAETLLLFLLAAAATRFAGSLKQTSPSWWRIPIATMAGVVSSALILKAITLEWSPPISDFHLTQSKPAAYGANVVNVILVDFRALDTLGEILVLAIAALGVTAVLGAARPRIKVSLLETPWVKTSVPLINTILVVIGLWVFWRGHNHSGGGFIGALLLATALGLTLLSADERWSPRRLRKLSFRLTCAGLIIALGAALSPLLVQKPFFTGLWWHSGDLHLGTPLLFDLGVLLTVLGFCTTYLRHFYAPHRKSSSGLTSKDSTKASSGHPISTPSVSDHSNSRAA